MIPTTCQLLGAYLDHDLSGDELARFTVHLESCHDCQQSARDQTQLDSLLSAATCQLQLIPPGLTDRVARRLRVAYRWRIAVAVGGLAAAIALILAIGRIVSRSDQPQSTAQIEVRPTLPEPERSARGERVRVTFPTGVLALSEEFDSPNVTYIRIYPGLRRTPQPEPVEDYPQLPRERSDP